MPVVVKPEYRQVVSLDERDLREVDRIARQGADVVVARIERGLVADHEVPTRLRRALQNVQRGHDRRGNSVHYHVRATGVEIVGRGGPPGRAKRRLDALHDLPGGLTLRGVRASRPHHTRGGEGRGNESSSGHWRVDAVHVVHRSRHTGAMPSSPKSIRAPSRL